MEGRHHIQAREFLPPPQLAEQGLGVCQSPRTQLAGQGVVLQGRVSVVLVHWAPGTATSVTLRIRMETPLPQVLT